MGVRVIKTGLLDTIQDAGRYGYQHWGINPGGAMDNTAMQLANMLAGNALNEAVIEMHFPAAEFLFEEPALIGLAGADLDASIDGIPIPPYHAALVNKDAVLSFNKHSVGARVYLAVHGGWIADNWLGSCSTHLKVKAGGKNGKALQKNDLLLLKKPLSLPAVTNTIRLPWQADIKALYTGNCFHFIPGAEYELLNDAAKTQLETASFILGRQYDRMGYRLQGAGLQYTTAREQISTAVTRGTMQLLPDGQLIILMADHQTTGGYPRIGHVIGAHIDSLSQLLPGAELSFQQTNMEKAEALLLQRQRNLQQLQNACNFRLAEWMATHPAV